LTNELPEILTAGESVFGLIDEPQEQNSGKKQLKDVKGAIKFNRVSFGYTDQNNVLYYPEYSSRSWHPILAP
jgi:ABC-type bacteriocin/lantibiotic exporter with double-glycine peptidase domain